MPLKRALKWLVTLAVLGGAGFALYVKVRPAPPLVTTQRVLRGSITETVSGVATGIVEPARRISVQAEAAARVKEVRVKRGDRVNAGAVLVVLNDADIQDQMRSLRAAIPVLEFRVHQARARASQLGTELTRTRKLVEKGVLARAQLDNASSSKEVAALEGDAAQAALQQARTNLEVARASLRKTVVRAPFAGVALDVFAEVGEQALSTGATGGSSSSGSSGTTASSTGAGAAAIAAASGLKQQGGLVDLADDSDMLVFVDVDEMDYGKLAVGQPANLAFDALNKRTLVGKVIEIYPYVSRAADQNRTVRVKIRLPDSARGVALPGMSVNVDIVVGRRDGVLVLPAACLLARGKGKAVLKLEGNRLHEVSIRLGVSTWEQTSIDSGVSEGEVVAVLSTAVKLVDGMQVRVAPATAAPPGSQGSAGAPHSKQQ